MSEATIKPFDVKKVWRLYRIIHADIHIKNAVSVSNGSNTYIVAEWNDGDVVTYYENGK
jgi:hypothetical protein